MITFFIMIRLIFLIFILIVEEGKKYWLLMFPDCIFNYIFPISLLLLLIIKKTNIYFPNTTLFVIIIIIIVWKRANDSSLIAFLIKFLDILFHFHLLLLFLLFNYLLMLLIYHYHYLL